MDAKPMTPAEIAALVRRLRNALLYESSGDGSALPEEAADCIDAQAAEITALRAERDEAMQRYEANDGMDGAVCDAIRRMLNDQTVTKAAFIDDHVCNAIAERNQAREEVASLRAERDALAARLAVPGEEAASMATRCTPEYAAGFWAGVEYGRHRPAGQHADVVQSDALSPAPKEPDHGNPDA